MLKYISEIRIKLTPYNVTSVSARSFLNRVSTDKNVLTNPDCKINTVVQSDLKKNNLIYIKFKDGFELNLKADSLKEKEITSEVDKYSRKLSLLDENK
ncbi:hypothetical protein K502DRAFT_164 [Neoconidiobolus thromboides FSU 785]|nr:hypothetical protein K502DRAFT_164 [Neoconidiobolus thromboides FSU 785]